MACAKGDTEEQRVLEKVEKAREGDAKTKHAARTDHILHRVEQLASVQQYEKALYLLKSAGRQQQFLNAKGVCLLRMGRADEASLLYRDLVLSPGSTWMRPDVPVAYKTNYATALLLSGHPSGCLQIVAEIKDEQNSTVQRLRAAIRHWESRLTFWQKLDWRLGRVEPGNRPVTIDFEAGEFERVEESAEGPAPITPPHSRTAA